MSLYDRMMEETVAPAIKPRERRYSFSNSHKAKKFARQAKHLGLRATIDNQSVVVSANEIDTEGGGWGPLDAHAYTIRSGR